MISWNTELLRDDYSKLLERQFVIENLGIFKHFNQVHLCDVDLSAFDGEITIVQEELFKLRFECVHFGYL